MHLRNNLINNRGAIKIKLPLFSNSMLIMQTNKILIKIKYHIKQNHLFLFQNNNNNNTNTSLIIKIKTIKGLMLKIMWSTLINYKCRNSNIVTINLSISLSKIFKIQEISN